MLNKALEKLDGAKAGTGVSVSRIIDYLIGRCKEDISLCEDVLHEKKTMDGCVKFIRSRAIKMQHNNMALVDDEIVFEWAEDYFRQDPEKMKEEPKAVKAKKQPEAQKKPETAVKPADTVEIIEEEKKAAKTAVKAEKAKSAKKEKPKKPSVDDGQMSLFDLMGAMS